MSILLDTHTFAWFFLGTGLSRKVREFIEDYEADVFVSAISAYEMALKHKLGLWPDAGPVLVDVHALAEQAHFKTLDINARHATQAGLLPTVHRDPFDRMIVAQAVVERLTVVSKEKQLEGLGAEVVWE